MQPALHGSFVVLLLQLIDVLIQQKKNNNKREHHYGGLKYFEKCFHLQKNILLVNNHWHYAAVIPFSCSQVE